MKWKSYKEEARMRAKAREEENRKWHKWFAWRPIKMDGYWHWLRVVERKWIPLTLGNFRLGINNQWDYRESTLRAG